MAAKKKVRSMPDQKKMVKFKLELERLMLKHGFNIPNDKTPKFDGTQDQYVLGILLPPDNIYEVGRATPGHKMELLQNMTVNAIMKGLVK